MRSYKRTTNALKQHTSRVLNDAKMPKLEMSQPVAMQDVDEDTPLESPTKARDDVENIPIPSAAPVRSPKKAGVDIPIPNAVGGFACVCVCVRVRVKWF